MGIRDALRALTSGGSDSFPYPYYVPSSAINGVSGLSVETLWRTQPHLRTVVSFLARNVAHVGFHMFEAVTETDRRRVRDDPFARILNKPNDDMTGYDLWYALVSDLSLYNEAFWLPSVSSVDGRLTVETVSPAWVTSRGGSSALHNQWFEFLIPTTSEKKKIAAADLYYFPSYNPGNPLAVSTPIDALRQLLFEQLEAQQFRRQIWKKAGRFGGFLTRPFGSKWDKDSRDSFRTDWNAKFGPDGAEAGGTPILEDGMEYKRPGYSAKEDDWLEGTKLAFATVANAYHVNPTMIGLLDNANFANVREFRRALYGDTLGPIFAQIESRVNAFVLPAYSPIEGAYVEANVREKLQGSFEEQTTALQSSVGRPWMTADEARALMNMPSLGGDAAELVTPLNVLVGGQASPNDTAPEPGEASAPIVLRVIEAPKKVWTKRTILKAADPNDTYRSLAERTLKAFFERQGAVVTAKLGAKAEWWDEKRWNRELSDDLFKVGMAAVGDVGPTAAAALGFKEDDFDVPRTEAYVRAMTDMRAKMVNSKTYDELVESDDPVHTFEVAETSRSVSGGAAFATALVAFATIEVGHQLVGDKRAEKTWIVESGNPRPSHAAMDGETVGLDEVFSNGANMPGDPAAGVEEVAGCSCSVEVSF